MASSGDVVQAVLDQHVEVEQLAEACDGESRSPATEESHQQPMLQEQAEQHDDVDTAPVADHHEAAPEQVPAEEDPERQHDDTAAVVVDHHEAVAAPEQVLVQASASEEPEQQKPVAAADDGQESTRERLKRHRREMAGRVWVPEMWGQEKQLKDWVDCAVFDRPLVPAGLLTARRALIAECCTTRPDRTVSPASSAGSSPLRVRNGCS